MSLSNEQALDKLKIYAYDDSGYGEEYLIFKKPFEVQFNPSEYDLSYEIEWENQQADNQTDAEQVFKRIKPSDLSFSFMIDGTGASGKKPVVKDEIASLFEYAYRYNGEKHKPNYLKVVWGKLEFRGVLQRINISYTLFLPNGEPLRAKADITLASHKDAELQLAENKPASPDLTHLRKVKDGDTLPMLCHKIYGDSKYYTEVARYNSLANFRKLATGTRIYFPPLKEVKA